MRDLLLQLSKSSIYSTKPELGYRVSFHIREIPPPQQDRFAALRIASLA
nr:hypothetical protein SYMBAF_190063 [Serratia symbiotica]